MSNKPTVQSIQMLRAIAASLVVIAHAQVHLEVRNHIADLNPFLDLGRVGVDLFFIISGFIMVYVAGREFRKPGAPRDFIVRRFIRVVPTYWIYTTALAALMITFPQLFSDGKRFDLTHYLASLAFIPWENNIGHIKPLLPVGWTLNYEIYFYLIFALLLFLHRKWFLPGLSFLLVGGVFAGWYADTVPTLASVATSPLLVEFLAGCCIGLLFTGNTDLPKAFSWTIALAGIAWLLLASGNVVPHTIRAISWGIPSAMIIAGILFLEKAGSIPANGLLVAIGGSSYSLYLTHIFTINALGKIWTSLIGGHYGLFIIACVFCSIIVGHIAYLAIEKPAISFLGTRYRSRRLNRAPAPT
ncbi:MAG TPA: acyltransferase [Gammaproteobacteria bacterium]|nr:acyltransferase [Gammaproteobacteria bacterium]